MPELRDYQHRSIDALRQSFGTGHRAPLLVQPTASGKTVIFSEVSRRALLKGTTALVGVHRHELVRQASEKLTDIGVAHGIIAAGTRPTEAPVQVASIQTVIRRLDTLGDVGLVILDEAHHAVAASWRRLMAALPKAKLLGVTATPLRLDGKGLGVKAGGLFDDLIIGATVAELIAAGWLSDFKVFTARRRLDLRGIGTVAGDYNQRQLADAVAHADLAGDAVAEYRKRADHQPAVAFCVGVRHAQETALAFATAGYRAACIHGMLSLAERDALIKGLADGTVEVLTSCEILGEGVDVPVIAAAILLRPTKSLALHLQQVGRGLRPAPGKAHLTVLDIAGNSLTHGLPDEVHAWTLDGKPKNRPAPTWECEACGCLNPIGALRCQECGAPRPEGLGVPRAISVDPNAELVELRRRDLARLVSMPYRRFTAEPRSEAELHAYARAHGYKRGWVWHILRQQAAQPGVAP